MIQIAQVWELAMRLPKCWEQPSQITVDCQRKIEELLELSSQFPFPQKPACMMSLPSHLESLKPYTGAFSLHVGLLKAPAVAFHGVCFLHGCSSIFELLRTSIQFTSWCNQTSPKGSRAHLQNQLLVVHPFTQRSK